MMNGYEDLQQTNKGTKICIFIGWSDSFNCSIHNYVTIFSYDIKIKQIKGEYYYGLL